MLAPLLLDVEAWPLAAAVRASAWAYPALEVMHISGFAALFGAMVTLESRVLGAQRIVMLQGLARLALPVAVSGFAVAAVSGALMFVSRATEIGPNPAFQVKLALIALAGVNAFAFHRRGSLTRADASAKAQALLSVLLWIAVIAAGRLIAYV